jgi:hypothetical protein
LGEQTVSFERDLHDEYLKKGLGVIERTEAVEKCAIARI